MNVIIANLVWKCHMAEKTFKELVPVSHKDRIVLCELFFKIAARCILYSLPHSVLLVGHEFVNKGRMFNLLAPGNGTSPGGHGVLGLLIFAKLNTDSRQTNIYKMFILVSILTNDLAMTYH